MIAPVHPLKVAEYLDDVYVRERLDLAPDSILNLRITCRLLDRFNVEAGGGPFLITDFCRETIIDWMRWQAEVRKCSPATINGKRGCAMAIWADAASKGYCEPPPLPTDRRNRVPKRIEPERIPVTWSLEEIDRIFASCAALPGTWENIPVKLLWIVALLVFWDTGCRLDEVRAALMKNVDLAGETLLCPAENRKGRRKDRLYPLHAQTIEAIKATLPSRRLKVFPFPYCERTLQVHFARILKSAGLPADRKRKFHCLRRTTESYAAREKGMQWAADAVGHNLQVAKKSYISPVVAPAPALIEAVPRPKIGKKPDARQMELF